MHHFDGTPSTELDCGSNTLQRAPVKPKRFKNTEVDEFVELDRGRDSSESMLSSRAAQLREGAFLGLIRHFLARPSLVRPI